MDTPNMQQPDSSGHGTGLSKKQQRRLEKQEAKKARHAGQMVKTSGSRIVFWLVIIAIIGFFVYAIGKLATSTPDSTEVATDIAITADDHVLGNPAATVQIIEYADFQCPGCAAFHPIVKQVVSEYGDKIAYTYRHYPLPQHQHAKIMAYAAEAAGLQGKFWEMSDFIYTNQRVWSPLISVNKTISEYATKLALNIPQFENEIDSSSTKDQVDADYRSGGAYGVNSTPTFFLNGTKISLPRSLDDFKAVIDAALLAA
jgi:protein-disulfide isomerase